MWKHAKIMHIHVKTGPTYNYAHPIDLIDWKLGSGSTETKAVLKSKYVITRSLGARWAPTSSLRPFGPA